MFTYLCIIWFKFYLSPFACYANWANTNVFLPNQLSNSKTNLRIALCSPFARVRLVYSHMSMPINSINRTLPGRQGWLFRRSQCHWTDRPRAGPKWASPRRIDPGISGGDTCRPSPERRAQTKACSPLEAHLRNTFIHKPLFWFCWFWHNVRLCSRSFDSSPMVSEHARCSKVLAYTDSRIYWNKRASVASSVVQWRGPSGGNRHDTTVTEQCYQVSRFYVRSCDFA